MFKRILIANRGEIARRIIRTCQKMNIDTVAVYSDADSEAKHVYEATEAIRIGPPPAAESYLNIEQVLTAARRTGVDAVHPGYGFLSENADFARAVIAEGLGWIGPAPKAIELMGDKAKAKQVATAAGVPVASSISVPLVDADVALAHGRRVGFPLMIKPSAGGGGIGMGVARDEAEFEQAWTTAASRSRMLFPDSTILLEQYTQRARHVEVQVLGLNNGRVIPIGERDCSVQRRHQKVVEECPSPGIDERTRAAMSEAAVTLATRVGYRGAGTVEFLYDRESAQYTFLEMNTRLQVEHPVTEAVYGIDLVEAQIRISAGETSPGFDPATLEPRGHAVELRIYAEDPATFFPSPGKISDWTEPRGDIRVDAGFGEGDVVTRYYDPLLAKVCVWASGRAEAVEKAATAIADFTIEGPKSNLPFLAEVLQSPEFISGDYGTSIVEELRLKIAS